MGQLDAVDSVGIVDFGVELAVGPVTVSVFPNGVELLYAIRIWVIVSLKKLGYHVNCPPSNPLEIHPTKHAKLRLEFSYVVHERYLHCHGCFGDPRSPYHTMYRNVSLEDRELALAWKTYDKLTGKH